METYESQYQREQDIYTEGRAAGIKRKLGDFGRRIKRIDVRTRITDHPFAAVGIAMGIGAIVGLARPMPKRGPIAGAMMAIASTIGFRMLREAALIQLGHYAKGFLNKDEPGMQQGVPQGY
ncbi:MAG TPA: hypothetical protein VFV99_02005 [Kofleriaceae bacterium]|nr:hypothetical protein [Kofleriaceae bacterium]